MIKQIFHANDELLEKYPFYRGYFMSNKEFQIEVVVTVYHGGQTFLEKKYGNTIYKNGIGFVKGKVGEILSSICRNGKFEAKEMAMIRAYGIRYTKQFFDMIDETRLKEFEEDYGKYASECVDMENRINALIKAGNTSEMQKELLEKEKNKLHGISKLENIKKNVENIVNNQIGIQMEFNFEEN